MVSNEQDLDRSRRAGYFPWKKHTSEHLSGFQTGRLGAFWTRLRLQGEEGKWVQRAEKVKSKEEIMVAP